MSYRLTRQARIDLAAIYRDGSRRFGTAVADEYLDGFFRTASLLASFPQAARERSEIVPPMRAHPYRSHLILYRIEDETDIVIVRVPHGRQDWMRA